MGDTSPKDKAKKQKAKDDAKSAAANKQKAQQDAKKTTVKK